MQIMKDRKSTEDQILAALDRLIQKQGFRGLGVNAVAKEASLSKILIYRYFDSFEGLLECWATNNSYWTGESLPLSKDLDASGNAKAVLGGYAHSLRSNPVKREVLRWFLAEKNDVGAKVMAGLEKKGIETTDEFKKTLQSDNDLDVDALICLFSAGISYLSLLSDRADCFNGVELNTDGGWKRINSTITEVVRRLLK